MEDVHQTENHATSAPSSADYTVARDFGSEVEEFPVQDQTDDATCEKVPRDIHDAETKPPLPVVVQDNSGPDIPVLLPAAASAGDLPRNLDDSDPEKSIPDVAPQDHLVPDVVAATPAVGSLVHPSLTGPSVSQTRKWLTIDGRVGTWQYDTGSSRARFVDKKAINKFSDSNEETLLKAARFGHDVVVATLLEQKTGTEFVEEERGRTPLLFAAEGGSILIVQMLLDNRAKWETTDNSRRTALHLASLNGRDEIVQLLLQHSKIDVDQKDDQGKHTAFCQRMEAAPDNVRYTCADIQEQEIPRYIWQPGVEMRWRFNVFWTAVPLCR